MRESLIHQSRFGVKASSPYDEIEGLIVCMHVY